ncbi:hypothetical protein FJZ39_00105 [Candidatus Saccharibacteria bacterium]|nr:hypothetical protein [Candidatus Saccharibacteria bacterium]
MGSKKVYYLVAIFVAVGLSIILADPAFAAESDVQQIENFIRSIIRVVAGFAGLVATGFFVFGGFTYITSSGNPEHLDRAKKTLIWAAIGLGITIAAFVLSNIITDIATGAFGG